MAGHDLDLVRRLTKQDYFETPFGGMWVNAAALARETKMDRTYVSRVLRGQRNMSLFNAEILSLGLGMSMDEFVSALHARRESLKKSA